mmetsp:Transcript_16176/g.48478  ORF Transcript_16176/g.48478 Transcript_16176/m.48478 type:complete len:454 (+) Transcript_16176:262-1623(+)
MNGEGSGPLAQERIKFLLSTPFARAAVVAQLASLVLAAVGACSATLSRQGVYLPTSQSLLVYGGLAAVFGWRLRRCMDAKPLDRVAWAKFAGLAFLDLEANFLVNKAYRYTSITSVTLLDCWSIVGVLVLTWALLGAKYRRAHLGGAALCIAGLALLVMFDSRAHGPHQHDGFPAAVFGDALVLVGASLYALCNVGQEALLGTLSNTQLLAGIGACGLALSCVQAPLLEHSQLAAAPWNWQIVALLGSYVTSMLVFYVLVPCVLRDGGAGLLNLSLLTSDLWAAAARYLFLGGFPWRSAAPFFGALALVAAGLSFFSWGGDVHTATPAAGTVCSAVGGEGDDALGMTSSPGGASPLWGGRRHSGPHSRQNSYSSLSSMEGGSGRWQHTFSDGTGRSPLAGGDGPSGQEGWEDGDTHSPLRPLQLRALRAVRCGLAADPGGEELQPLWSNHLER